MYVKIIKTLFRGISVKGKLVYGNCIQQDTKNNHIFIANKENDVFTMEYTKVKNLETSTGLKDKNGRDIFVGDILKRVKGHSHIITSHLQEVLYVVKFDTNKLTYLLSFENKMYLHVCEIPSNMYEVVGNIHENPELLDNNINLFIK